MNRKKDVGLNVKKQPIYHAWMVLKQSKFIIMSLKASSYYSKSSKSSKLSQQIFNELNNSQLINSKDDILDKLKNLNIQKNNFLDCKSDFYSKFVKNKNTSLQNLHITFFNKIIY